MVGTRQVQLLGAGGYEADEADEAVPGGGGRGGVRDAQHTRQGGGTGVEY